MKPRSRVACAVVALVLCVTLVSAGCSSKKNTLRPNLPPETTVFVRGPIDTVSHRVHIYWFGSDVDGEVASYRMRFVYPPPASQTPPWDTLSCGRVGRCTDSLFTVFTGDSGVVSPRFEIAAIDDDGAVDPSPAIQTFLLTNIEPRVLITSGLGPGDTTYASVTVSWQPLDPDGGGPGLRFRLWLDGNAAYDSTTQNTFTLASSRFLQGGTFVSGPRTLFIQAVDDGGRVGPPTSMTWYVRAPAATLLPDHRGELLVIDEVPSSSPINTAFDSFYQGIVTDTLGTARISVLRPQFNPRIFRSARDFAQTLRQFRAVLWYRGIETSISPLLKSYQDSLSAYLDAGGRLYLDGLYLIEGLNTEGALRADFLSHLGSTGMFLNLNTAVADSTAGWGNSSASRFLAAAYDTSFRATISAPAIQNRPPGIRCFVGVDPGSVVLTAQGGPQYGLVPVNSIEMPVGVSAPQMGGGRLVMLSLPLRIGSPSPAGTLLRRILFGYQARPGLLQ